VVADFIRLEQECLDARTYARQARVYARMARARVIRTQQEVQHAYRRTLTAYMALSMPMADTWTRDITATILLRHGLLGEKPAGQQPAAPRKRAKGSPR
jgi:hypothetical protein